MTPDLTEVRNAAQELFSTIQVENDEVVPFTTEQYELLERLQLTMISAGLATP